MTAVLPTLITDAPEKMRAAARAVEEARPDSGVAGVHFEGPFISVERRGIHPQAHVRPPTPDDIRFLVDLARRLDVIGRRVLVTLAPEVVGDDEIRALADGGALVSLGHTAASFERVEAALAAGARGFTHVSNGMPPLVNRSPGPLAAALASPEAWCGLIADGRHVHPGLMRTAARAKPRGKIHLVTDAMPPLGTDLDSFDLLGTRVHRSDGCLVDAGGTLAGAVVGLAEAVRNAVEMIGLSLEEALRWASANPAAFARIDDRAGRIAPGRPADLAVIGADGGVLETWIAGRRVWRRA